MSTYDNGCVDTPDWVPEARPVPEYLLAGLSAQERSIPEHIVLGEN